MSCQSCHCGWSKVTTYQGLRTHQGKMGCTPKGMGIPESEQFRFSSHLPSIIYGGPRIHVEDHLIFTPPFKPAGQQNTWGNSWETSGLLNRTTPIKTETFSMSPNLATLPATEYAVTEALKPDTLNTSDMSYQSCHCGWSKVTTYQGLRTHQGKMGCTPKGMGIPESEQFRFSSHLPSIIYEAPRIHVEDHLIFTPPFKPVMGTQDPFRTPLALDFASGAQSPPTVSTQANPSAAEVTMEEANNAAFQTPPLHSAAPQTTAPQTTGNARRALDFSAYAQQPGQQPWHLPTTTAQETVNAREKEKEAEREKEKEREAQKLQRARQDRLTAELQQNIQTRERKTAEVRSCVKACKGVLDAEWLEINSVFSQVMRVVEGARQKALQPVEERRKRVKREAQDMVQKLQKEIDELKMTIDELHKNPDLKVSPQSCDWNNFTVDSSFSFGTLRTTTSIMMKEIHRELEKLSSVELKRIPTFAVDVELDPTTAHPSLVLSPDGKSVRDGGKYLKVPDRPQRFDMFGSILGLDRLTSGKSYWEVDVSNKTGWDLGVARRDAKRKGTLSLDPGNGYWVTVHYEDKKYAALTAPPVSLSLTEKPQKVGVFVDYEEGLVSFYDVGAKSHIYSFTECSFSGGIFPYFSPHLKHNKNNSHPLIISAVVVNV